MRCRIWTLLVAVHSLFAFATAFAQPGTTTRVSVSSGGLEGDSGSAGPAISADGRFVAFYSTASNLVPDDTNWCCDVLVRDRVLGITERVSVTSSGEQGDWDSGWGPIGISADGRFVAFTSYAALVPDDWNYLMDIYVRDRLKGTTERVSVSSFGDEADADCIDATISADGSFVAFDSSATNLVPDDTNGFQDVFVHDRATGITETASIGPAGEEGNEDSERPSLSADGRFVSFVGHASNLVPGDTNDRSDIFVRDRLTGKTELVSVSSTGEKANDNSGWFSGCPMSADGRYVVFMSMATNLVPGDTNRAEDAFLRDRQTGTTTRVSVGAGGAQANSGSVYATMSANGRFVEFTSYADNLESTDFNMEADIFVRDLWYGNTRRASVSSSGQEGNARSGLYRVDPVRLAITSTSLSADGRFVAFCSEATNLVDDDTNETYDVFVHESDEALIKVSGKFSFKGLAAGAAQPTVALIRTELDGQAIGTTVAELDADGAFSVALPPGKIVLSAKPFHWLRKTLKVDGTQGDVSGVNFDLTDGDVSDDNRVNLLDLSLLMLYWDTHDGVGDLDGNGTVEFGDLSVVLSNFGRIGAP